LIFSKPGNDNEPGIRAQVKALFWLRADKVI